MRVPKYIRLSHKETIKFLRENASFEARNLAGRLVLPFAYVWIYFKIRSIRISMRLVNV